MNPVILEVRSLTVRYSETEKNILNDLNFVVYSSEILSLRGRSGSGKSTVAMGIMGMLGEYKARAEGYILYEGNNLLTLPEREMRKIRWKNIAMVPQSSMNAFNPRYTIRRSLREMMLQEDRRIPKEKMAIREAYLIDMVHLDKQILSCYAHEMSGGMKQRAAIALAMIHSPRILILDEATTGLDIKSQADVLGTILRIKQEQDMTILFISHDAELADNFSDRRVELP
jgi:peptide/nickel transport system ATP-binding protein